MVRVVLEIKNAFFTLVGLLLLLACNDVVVCDDIQNNLYAGFYVGNTSIKVNKFSAWGTVNPDSLFYKSVKDVTQAQLTLSPISDSANIVFWIEDLAIDTLQITKIIMDTDDFGIQFPVDTLVTDSILHVTGTDTLHFFYSRQLRAVSPDCGFTHDFQLNTVKFTRNLIDTVIIMNANLNTVKDENIRILF